MRQAKLLCEFFGAHERLSALNRGSSLQEWAPYATKKMKESFAVGYGAAELATTVSGFVSMRNFRRHQQVLLDHLRGKLTGIAFATWYKACGFLISFVAVIINLGVNLDPKCRFSCL